MEGNEAGDPIQMGSKDYDGTDYCTHTHTWWIDDCGNDRHQCSTGDWERVCVLLPSVCTIPVSKSTFLYFLLLSSSAALASHSFTSNSSFSFPPCPLWIWTNMNWVITQYFLTQSFFISLVSFSFPCFSTALSLSVPPFSAPAEWGIAGSAGRPMVS